MTFREEVGSRHPSALGGGRVTAPPELSLGSPGPGFASLPPTAAARMDAAPTRDPRGAVL